MNKDILLGCGKSVNYICSCICVSNKEKDEEKRNFFAKYLLDNGVDKNQIRNGLINANKSILPSQNEVIDFYNHLCNKEKDNIEPNDKISTKIIEFKGQILETKHFMELSDEKYLELKKEYYKKPEFNEVIKQFKNIAKGGTKNDKITNYYVKDLMAKVKLYHSKWSIEDVWECKDLVARFYAQTFTNDKVFTGSDIKNIETAMRLGGKGVASKPTNFPIKTVDYILENYNVNGNWYDFSCGWGARLTGALKHNVNYFGTDPNFMLTDRLHKLASDYKEVVGCTSTVDIRVTGSEIYNADWENKMGLAFSSPPYFYLEDYKVGKQSYTEGTSYEDWKNNYLKPTIRNIYYYLIQEGYFLLNINNFENYDLVGDSIAIAEEIGFKLVKTESLKNIERCKSTTGFNDNSEKILVFTK